ncbi:hypothetical protein CBL_20033 [Carabus blaptoides fortunei]
MVDQCLESKNQFEHRLKLESLDSNLGVLPTIHIPSPGLQIRWTLKWMEQIWVQCDHQPVHLAQYKEMKGTITHPNGKRKWHHSIRR